MLAGCRRDGRELALARCSPSPPACCTTRAHSPSPRRSLPVVHCLASHLQGQYAFALLDGERRQVLAARDSSGTEPLFYQLGEDGAVSLSNAQPPLACGDDGTVHWTELPPGHFIAGRTPRVQQFALTPQQLEIRESYEVRCWAVGPAASCTGAGVRAPAVLAPGCTLLNQPAQRSLPRLPSMLPRTPACPTARDGRGDQLPPRHQPAGGAPGGRDAALAQPLAQPRSRRFLRHCKLEPAPAPLGQRGGGVVYPPHHPSDRHVTPLSVTRPLPCSGPTHHATPQLPAPTRCFPSPKQATPCPPAVAPNPFPLCSEIPPPDFLPDIALQRRPRVRPCLLHTSHLYTPVPLLYLPP